MKKDKPRKKSFLATSVLKKEKQEEEKKTFAKNCFFNRIQVFFVVIQHNLETRRKRKEEEKELECLFSHFFPRVLMLIKHREVGLC